MQTLEIPFAEIIKSVSGLKERTPDVNLTAFFPLRGLHAKNELMVVGRAVNGWGEDRWTPCMAGDDAERERIVSRVQKTHSNQTECSLSWIANDPGDGGLWGAGSYCKSCKKTHRSRKGPCPNCQSVTERVYSTAKSAFWRVIKQVVEKTKIPLDGCWSSALIWSNLYKVAPATGGNPLAAQIRVQQAACLTMFHAEVEAWKPRRILFLTGDDWADPFLTYLNAKMTPLTSGMKGQAGRLRTNSSETVVVVSPHPQGKSEQAIVSQITEAFNRLTA